MGKKHKIRLSLRSKFYLLVLPVLVVVAALIVMVLVPHTEINGRVTQIKEGLAEALHSEGFASQYEKQLRECAAYIATGNQSHPIFYAEAKRKAVAAVDGWITAEERHTGDQPAEHAEELKTQHNIKQSYAAVTAACDSAMAQADAGDRAGAMATLGAAEEGGDGQNIQTLVGELLPEEEAQLVGYVDNLTGSVRSLSIFRLIGLQAESASMKNHVLGTIAAEEMARYYNAQVKDAMEYLVLGSEADKVQWSEGSDKADAALESWLGQLEPGDTPQSPKGREMAVIENSFDSITGAQEQATAVYATGDAAGAINMMESATNPATQTSLTGKIDDQIAGQQRALEQDAGTVTSTNSETTWWVGFACALFLVIAGGGSALLSRTVVKPVRDLNEAAGRFGGGALDARVEVKSRDEIGELANTFNEMAAARVATEDQLVRARDDLEVKVDERTRDLAGANEQLHERMRELERAESELQAGEQKYRVLAETLPQVVFEIDSQGKISYVNENALEMFGYDPLDFERGIPALEIIDPSDHERVAGAISKMMDGRSTGAVREYLARRKDGSTFPCIVYSTLVQDGEGNPAGIRGILTDISDRKQMEQALREEQEFTRTIINSLKDIFYVLSVEKGGLLVRWNSAFNTVSGYSDEELASMTVFDFFDAESQQAQQQFLATLMAEGSAVIEGDAIMKDGHAVLYHFSSTLVRDDEGKPLYVSGVGRDMTEVKKAAEALRQTTEYLENLFDYANAPIIVWDIGSRITRFNHAFERLAGYAASEVIGEDLALLFPTESKEESLAKIRDALTGRYWESVEIPILTKEGQVRIALWNSANVYGADGETVMATIAQGQDITERKKVEEALRESEERYRQIFENATEGVFQTNMEGTIRSCNPSFARMYGYDSPEQMKQEVTDVAAQLYYNPADRQEIKHLLARNGVIRGMELRFRCRDGSPLWVIVNVHLVRDREGNILFLEGTTTDISERIKVEELLRLTQFEADGAMDQIIRVGKNGRIVYANDTSALQYGYTRHEMMDRSVWDISLNFPEDQWPEIFETIKDLGTMSIETVAVRSDGLTFPLEANITYLPFERKEYIVIFGRDITERRIAELRQEHLNEELVSTNKELNDFAYVVSHDLKAPLRGIGSLANWLATDYSDKLDDEGKMQLSLLLDRAKRMESLIESVLKYSRLGRVRESKELVDLSELVRESIEMIAPPQGMRVTVKGTLPTVYCEKTRMSQVFSNLIGNAVKFMDKPDGEVEISATDEGDRWLIAVADNGPGIDERYHEKIFEIFQSLTDSDDGESTGIGLTLVKKVVELHGGRVWVELQPGRGATFYFTLPKTDEDEI